MTSTPGGVIQSLSASQAEEFDPEQVGGCPRRWYYHRVERLPLPERENSKVDGDAGHALFAMHYRGEALPKRARMLKAVRGAIAKGDLPPPAPGQLIESRFDGQPARDANGERVPLRHSTTLWLRGVPWDGYVDLRFCHDDTITVLDHKFSSDIHTYAKSDLLATVQMPVYALDSLRIWPDAQHVELMHHYVSRRGVDSFIRRQLVTADQVEQRAAEIDMLVARMQIVARAPSADDVPANKKSCHTWSGCPFQSRCSAFKEKPKMNLSDEELSWLEVVGGGGEEEKPPADDRASAARAAERLGAMGKPRCELCGGVSDHAHGDCPSLTKPAVSGSEAEIETGKAPVTGPEADRATAFEMAEAAGALDDDPFAVFAPQASAPQEQPAPPVTETAKPVDGAKCPDCPHPAHPGAACTKKRSRGTCRCGAPRERVPEETIQAAAATREALAAPDEHLATCVQDDAGKRLCMEGCTAGKTVQEIETDPATAYQTAQASPEGLSDALKRERDMHRRTLGELDAVHRELERLRGTPMPPNPETPPTGWTGTLQVNVNLGPETLAILQRLLGGR